MKGTRHLLSAINFLLPFFNVFTQTSKNVIVSASLPNRFISSPDQKLGKTSESEITKV